VLPHVSILQADEQPSHDSVLSSSHSSFGSSTPSPHEGGGTPPHGVRVSFCSITGDAGTNVVPAVIGGTVSQSSWMGLPARSVPAVTICPHLPA
jgi:hypothetical protein